MRKGLWEKLKFDLGLERENERRNRGERILQVDMGGGAEELRIRSKEDERAESASGKGNNRRAVSREALATRQAQTGLISRCFCHTTRSPECWCILLFRQPKTRGCSGRGFQDRTSVTKAKWGSG